MKLVKATDQSQRRKVRIKELGRLAKVGEEFVVTDERYSILSGDNKFKVAFVTKVTDLKPEKTVVEKVNLPTENTKNKVTIPVDEEPEIILIEPNKEPTLVNEDLSPIVEPELDPENLKKVANALEDPKIIPVGGKKKRGRKKKVEVEKVQEDNE